MQDVIVIGNSPEILGRGLGSIINNTQTVVRLNCFKTVGFENDVGTKTDIYFVARKALPVSGQSESLYKYARVYYIPGLKRGHLAPSADNITVVKDEFIKYLCGKIGLIGDKIPSTGIISLEIMTLFYGTIKCCGFDFMQCGHVRHYYQSQKLEITKYHDWDLEKKYFDFLVGAGCLIPV